MGDQVLVTGAAGFIGRYVVRALLSRGFAVRALVRNPARFFGLAEGDVEVLAGDLRDADAVRRAVSGCRTVYHLGAVYSFGPAMRREAMEVNVGGTRNVLAAMRGRPDVRLVHVGSAGILAGSGILSPDAFPSSPPPSCSYKTSKWMSEREVLRAAEEGADAVIASPSCPIGAEDERPTPTGRIILDFLQGRFPFSSRTGINLAGVRDVAAGILAVGARGVRGRRYLLGQENLFLTEFLARLGRQAGLPSPRFEMPWPVILAAGLCSEILGRFIPCSGRLCLETALQARRCQFIDAARTEREIGWKAEEPLDRSIAEAIDWFKPPFPRAGLSPRPTARMHVS